MDEKQAASLLIEAGTGLNKKVSVYLTRLLLRIFENPSLMSYLTDVATVPDEEKGEGAAKIQLSFLRLPQEIMPQLDRLFAAPKKAQMFRFVQDGVAHHGFEIKVQPEDFEGDAYTYAF